jgi:hypothetical protein
MTRTRWAAVAVAALLMVGCGGAGDDPAQPRTADGRTPSGAAECGLPADLVTERPWVLSIPC